MFRLKKLIGIILIFGIVFFIVCDEKGYKFGYKNGSIVLDEGDKKIELLSLEKSDKVEEKEPPKPVVYKHSNIIHVNPEFENPRNLRKSLGIDPEYLAKLEEEKKIEEEKIKYKGPNILSIDDTDTISNVFQKTDSKDNTGALKPEVKHNTGTKKPETKQSTGESKPEVKPEVKEYTGTIVENIRRNSGAKQEAKSEVKPEVKPEVKQEIKQETTVKDSNIEIGTTSKTQEVKTTKHYKVEKYEPKNITLNMYKGVIVPKAKPEKEELALNTTENKNSEPEILYKNSNRIQLYSGFENPRNMRRSAGIDEEFLAKQEDQTVVIPLNNTGIVTSTWKYENQENIEVNNEENVEEKIEENNSEYIPEENTENNTIEPNNIEINTTEIIEPKEEKITYKIEKYEPKTYKLNMKKGVLIKHDFIVDNTEVTETTETSETTGTTENWLSDSMLESLLENEEINIETLDSENDEFLQKVFEKTRDIEVMNLIVETYLNEYQFVKAKKYIENLPEEYRSQLKPSLNLRVAFNSFPLSSKNFSENLATTLQEYSSNGYIFDEDKNRYLGVLALMDRNYDKFFEISNGFTSEKNKAFTSKLQGYKDQIAKQMGMPGYYFDTLVSLELFNQGLFQPAKVLALYSLQQNTNYILPYQILAYANFLTNSRDTSIEYLKKLEDIDPNNAEKYRFLMGVAYYWDNKYEQSVVMLSMVKDEKLRLDAQRYLINDYLKLDQKNKLISNRNKLLGYENLVASDFYTYFYETFFRPYSQGAEFELYALDIELANKMLRVCSTTLQNEEKAVCTYGTIGRNIALGQFDGLEQYLLNLVAEYPQGYLYQALGDYYLQHLEFEKARAYLLKAVSLTQKRSELAQIKKLLNDAI